ncbi:MAG: hypothetical protein AAGD43_06665 [Pseudomonadota bacterium]
MRMRSRPRHVLSIAVQATKLGHAFLIDDTPYDWDLSQRANRSTEASYDFTTATINYYQPELIITERISANPHKGEHAAALANCIWKAAQDSNVPWLCVDRVQRYANKYVEAHALANRFPELQPYLPKTRTLWDEEPRRMIIFEAVALGLSSGYGPVDHKGGPKN